MIKKIIVIGLSIVFLAVVAFGAFIALIDPNELKTLITNEVKKSTGHELVIDGDIKWTFWPRLGLSIDKLALKNPQGFAQENMLSFESAVLSVAVAPLFSDTLDVGVIRLKGAELFCSNTC